VRRPTPPSLSPREYRSLLARVLPAITAADAITLGKLSRVRAWHKADGSEVTAADHAAERVLRRHIGAAWPRDAILGEEFGGTLVEAGRCWTIDPIDGTASYVLGLPVYGTLLALLVDGTPVFGCISVPGLAEITYAATGHGCWWRHGGRRAQRVHVARPQALGDAQVSLTSFRDCDLGRPAGKWRISALAPHVGRMRFVGDCLQYALVCRGALDAAIDPRMNPWDIAPLVPCVLEAGGAVGDLAGARGNVLHSRSFVAASSEALRRQIVRHLAARRD
jgi:histidinol-phosphatase